MTLFNRSMFRVLVCAGAMLVVSVAGASANAAPPAGEQPAPKAGEHHRHLSHKQKAHLRQFLKNHPEALKHHRHHAGGKAAQGQHGGDAKPSAN